MKKEEMFDVLGDIDAIYVKEAGEAMTRAGGRNRRIRVIMAACLAFVAILSAGIIRNLAGGRPDVAILNNGETIAFMKSDAVSGQLSMDMAVTSRELTEGESRILFGDLPVSGYVFFHQEEHRPIGFEGKINGMKLVVSTSGLQLLDTIIDGIEKSTIVSGVSVSAGFFLTNANSRGVKTAIYYAAFELGGYTIYVENSGPAADRESVKNELAQTIQQLIRNGEIDINKIK